MRNLVFMVDMSSSASKHYDDEYPDAIMLDVMKVSIRPDEASIHEIYPRI